MTAEVAIKQQEASGDAVPSSLNEFAEATLDSAIAANAISAVSMFTNCCILSFGLVRAGSIAAALADAGSGAVDNASNGLHFATAMGGVLAAALSLLTSEQLASLASVACVVLFSSFATLLLPGLASIQDPLAAFLTPPTSDDTLAAVAQAAPIILTTSIYQNIVPSVTKILGYDRVKVPAVLLVGSLLPILMYVAWCFAVVGGDLDPHVGAGGPVITAFSIAAVFGSVIGCSMSLTEEIQAVVSRFQTDNIDSNNGSNSSNTNQNVNNNDIFSFPAAAAAVSVPLLVANVFNADANDFSAPLRMAGSYGSPFLYGVVPVLMAWTQRQKLQDSKDLVPGGMVSLGAVMLMYGGFIVAELGHDLTSLFVHS